VSWRDLLQHEDERVTLPWTGSRELRSFTRTWTIVGDLPREHGWYSFKILKGRSAVVDQHCDAQPELLDYTLVGYLVGNRIASDTDHTALPGIRTVYDPQTVARQLERVFFVEEGLDRFARARVGRIHAHGPLIFHSREMPLGPEDDVVRAYEDRAASTDAIKHVTPGLDAAFRMASWQRAEAERRRIELEHLRLEAEAKRAAEERRQGLIKQLGDGAGRRAMAKVDFETAARAALAVGGAELLDHRIVGSGRLGQRHEHVVKYRLDGQRFECVCDETMHIIDAGICLQDHRTGIKGDTFFTLESLPSVVREAEREGVLVVFRRG
jgi:hypothetical protein